MVTQYDEKGKIFTQVVSKRPQQVTIHTGSQTIHGCIYVRPEERVKDELNGQEQFLAVTDVIVYNSQNEEQARCSFLVLNKDQIIWVIPEEETSR